MEQKLREMFEVKGVEMSVPPTLPHDLRSRIGRQRIVMSGLVAAAVVGIAVFALATIGVVRLPRSERTPVIAPAASPPPVTQKSPPLTERFDSPLQGVSIGYPSGWRTRAATEPWGHDEVTFGAPDVDVIFDPKLQEDLYFAVVSEPLGGTSGSDWVQDMPPTPGICERAVGAGGGSTKLDGNPAWVTSCDSPVAGGHVAIVATPARGYIIYLHVGDQRRLQATYDGDWFEAALETVDLHPEDAVDELNP